MDMSSSKVRELVMDRETWHAVVHGVVKSQTRLSDWTEVLMLLNWCCRRLLRVPWTARRSNQSILKEMSPEYSLEGLRMKLKLILWPPDGKNWLTGKNPDAGKVWRQEEKVMTAWVGWHHWLDGHEFEQAPGVSDGQRSLTCCSP